MGAFNGAASASRLDLKTLTTLAAVELYVLHPSRSCIFYHRKNLARFSGANQVGQLEAVMRMGVNVAVGERRFGLTSQRAGSHYSEGKLCGLAPLRGCPPRTLAYRPRASSFTRASFLARALASATPPELPATALLMNWCSSGA